MATEIERKYLVTSDEWKEGARAGTAISQGYLCADDERSVRVRLAGDAARLTIKGASEGIARSEYEYDIPKVDAGNMLEGLCVGTPVFKTRYEVEHGGHVWEVDVFEGANAGLVLAEVELDRRDESVDLPAWVGDEVTDNERYFNAYLTRHPYGEWES